MDFIFDDDMDEVGSDIEAYCPKCKADTAHTVINKYEDEIRRVQCSPCGDVHSYRKPRGEIEDDVPEPIAAKKRAQLKKPTWQEARDKAGAKALDRARPYSIRDSYTEGDIVSHPKFGLGFVTEISENKVEVTFEDERRVLVHNRPDLAAVMPAIAQAPAPRDDRKGKKSQKGAAAKGAAKPEPKKAPAPAAKGAAAANAKAVTAAPSKKVERAKAAAKKKSAVAGKPAARPAAKRPAAKSAARPARPKARAARPAARRPAAAKAGKKLKVKAKKK